MTEAAIELVERDNAAILRLRGRLGIAEVGTLRETTLRAMRQPKQIQLDLREVEHLGASALQICMALEADLARNGRRLRMAALEGSRRSGLEASGWASLAPQGGGE